MPSFERPALPELIRRDTSDFEHELGTQAPRLPGTPEYAFVRAHAGVAHGLHGRIDRVRRDAFLATCSDEAAIQKARMFGVFAIPATMATGLISIGGEIGTIVPVNTVFVRDDGFTYLTTESAEAEGEGVALCPARALTSGPEGNMTAGTKLALQTPIVDMDAAGQSGEGGWQNGEPPETTASLRRRLQKRLADPPKGGGPGDYVRWALGDADEEKVPAGKTPPAGRSRRIERRGGRGTRARRRRAARRRQAERRCGSRRWRGRTRRGGDRGGRSWGRSSRNARRRGPSGRAPAGRRRRPGARGGRRR